ncbi:hypothetical protein ACNOYE_23250 [Nannocystaceae bacterium ST9]
MGSAEPFRATSTSQYFVRDDGIVVQAVVSNQKQMLADARENTRVFNEIADGRRRLLLVDMRVAYAMDPKAREFYATPEAARFVLALALVTPSTTTRVLGNFFLGLNKPTYPCRMFSNVDEAASWLLARGRELEPTSGR